MMMVTGTLVPMVGEAAPSIVDISVHLGRELRFGRSVKTWWTVLHHSFVVETICADMLENRSKEYRTSVRLYALLHDAHESVTGDIPTPYKTEEMKQIQSDLDRRIFASLGLPEPPLAYRDVIKKADDRALLAEGATVAPAGWLDAHRQANGGKFGFDLMAHHKEDCEIVRSIATAYPDPRSTFGIDSLGPVEYRNAVRQALEVVL